MPRDWGKTLSEVEAETSQPEGEVPLRQMADDLGVTEPLPKGPVTEPLQYTRAPAGAVTRDWGATINEIEQENQVRYNRLQYLFEQGLQKAPNEHAGILTLARETGLKSSFVESQLPAIKNAVTAAKFDPKKFHEDNPKLAQLLLDNPEQAKIVMHDEEVPLLVRAFRQWDRWTAPQGAGGKLATLMLGPAGVGAAAAVNVGTSLVTGRAPQAKKGKGPQPMVESEAGKLSGLERIFGKWETTGSELPDTGPSADAMAEMALSTGKNPGETKLVQPGIFQEAFQANQKQVEYSKLGYELLNLRQMAASTGKPVDTWELEKKVNDLKQELGPRYYNANSVEKLLLDAVELAPSQIAALKGGGIGGVLGAGLAGGTALAVTRNAGAARAAGAKGWKWGSRAGAFMTSYELESGSAYLEYLDTKTDDGKLMDENVARGAAQLYGVVAAAVEVDAMGPFLGMFGPLGDAVAKGEGRAYMAGLLRDRSFRAVASDIGKRMVKGAHAEGKEEFIQQIAQDTAGYFGKVVSAGKLQTPDMTGSAEAAVEAYSKAFTGTGVIGVAGVAPNLLTYAYRRDAVIRGGARVAKLAEFAEKSPSAQGAPQVVADLLTDQTARTGEPLDNVYVKADAFVTLFQGRNEDAAEAARQLMGPEGPRKLQEALAGASGGKLEIPVAEYLEKWGKKQIAQALAGDTTSQATLPTINEQVQHEENVQKHRKELFDAFMEENAPAPASAAERRLVDAVQSQLAATGTYKPKDARKAVAVVRAFVRTQAEEAGVSPDALFDAYSIEVEKVKSVEPEALAQSAAEAKIAEDKKRWEAMTPAERERAMYLDPNTGIRNARTFEARTQDPARPLIADISVEGTKYKNREGHDQGDALYRAAAQALHSVTPDVYKVGGDFKIAVKDESELTTILAQANANMAAKGYALTGKVGKTSAEAQAAHVAWKQAEETAGRRAKRGEKPFAVSPGTLDAQAVSNAVIPEALRAAFGQMPNEQTYLAVNMDPTTGLLSRQGFFFRPKRKFKVSLDLNKLKRINEDFGMAGGDSIIANFAKVARSMGAEDLDFAHFSGDEFALQGDDQKQLQAFVDALGAMCDDVRVKMPDGQFVEGITFGYGIGDTYAEADKRIEANKAAGIEAERAARQARALDRQGQGDGGGGAPVEGRDGQANAGGDSQGPRIAADKLLQGERGFVKKIWENSKKIFRIGLTEEADLSTFLHESAHIFLDVMGDMAERQGAPDRLVNDWKQTLAWLGATGRDALSREHHEKWARGFETYLREGKAPSLSLAGAFQRFKLWLGRIYKEFAPEQIDDSIRAVFDRMLATDAEIERAKLAMGWDQPIFNSPEEAGMNPAEFAEYLEEREKALSSANLAAQRRAAKEQLRVTDTFLKSERKKAKADAEAEYDNLPATRATNFLNTNDAGGNEALASVAKEAGRRVGLLREAMENMPKVPERWLDNEGLYPDELAHILGVSDGETLIWQITQLKDREQWVPERTEELLRERHTDTIEERQKLAEIANQMLHNQGSSAWLIKEWKALRKKAKGEDSNTPTEAIELAARDIVEATQVRYLNASRVLNAERASAGAAAVALAQGNFRLALVEKQKQILNHFMFKFLDQVRGERELFQKLSSQLKSPQFRSELGLGGQIFLDTSDTILEALHLKDPETDPVVLARRPSLIDTMKALDEAGVIPSFAGEWLAAALSNPPNDWRDLKVRDLRFITSALTQLYAAAKASNEVTAGKEKVRVDGLVEKIQSEAAALPEQAPPGAKGLATRLHKGLQRADAVLVDPEQLVKSLGETAGRFFWDGYLAARTREDVLANKVRSFILGTWDEMPEDLKKHRLDLLPAAELAKLPYPSDVWRDSANRNRTWMWMVALNMGNRSNMERLLGGYGWDESDVRMFLAKNMTSAEWDFVESIWKLLDKELYPEVAKHYEEVNGIRPKKIEALPFTLPNGRTVSGGYFPAKYDPIAARKTESLRQEELSHLYQQRAAGYTVARSFTEARAKSYDDVINLDWDVVSRHLAQVVHYVAFDSFVRDAAKVLGRNEVRDTVNRKLGEPYYGQLQAWLQTAASPGFDAPPDHLTWLYGSLGELRSRFVLASIGYSLSVAAGDMTNPLTAIASGRTKSRYGVQALGEGLLHFQRLHKEARELSSELRHRADRARMRMLQLTGEIGNGQSVMEKVRQSAWVFMETTDLLTSTVIWKGAFNQALSEKLSFDEAVRQADETVRSQLPSHNLAEQPSLLRDKRGAGSLIAFYGYFSKLYNVNREIWEPVLQQFQSEDATAGQKALSAAHAAGRTLAVIFVANILGELLSGRGPEPDETWAEWAIRKALAAPSSYLPFVGQFGELGANMLVSKIFQGETKLRQFSVRASPAAAAMDRMTRSLLKMFDSKKETDDRLWAALETFGVIAKTPVGSAQVGRTGRALTSGEVKRSLERGAPDAAAGQLIYGERKKQPLNLGTSIYEWRTK